MRLRRLATRRRSLLLRPCRRRGGGHEQKTQCLSPCSASSRRTQVTRTVAGQKFALVVPPRSHIAASIRYSSRVRRPGRMNEDRRQQEQSGACRGGFARRLASSAFDSVLRRADNQFRR